MRIMNLAWPIAALFGSLAVVWLYAAAAGRSAPMNESHDRSRKPPFATMVAKGALHCGGGCALGDILAEWPVFMVLVVAVGFGWHTVFADKMFAAWIVDYLFAYAFGIAFQYYTIKPMGQLSPRERLVAAIKADKLSLRAWQIGIYGLVAIASLVLFPQVSVPTFGRTRSSSVRHADRDDMRLPDELPRQRLADQGRTQGGDVTSGSMALAVKELEHRPSVGGALGENIRSMRRTSWTTA